MMKRLIAIALVAGGVTIPAGAQRGGSRGGSMGRGSFAGHSGGFAAHSGFASYNTPQFSGSARSASMAAPQFRGSPYAAATSNLRIAAPALAQRGYGSRRGIYRLPYLPTYALGLPYGLGYLGSGCLGFADCGYYDDSAYAAPAAPAYYPPEQYPSQPTEQADAAPPNTFRPPYQSPQPPPQPEDAVTLVFKDGRPSEQIHNYMLTRTTLTVLDGHRREVPVDQLDLAATVKANSDAGIAFQLPQPPR